MYVDQEQALTFGSGRNQAVRGTDTRLPIMSGEPFYADAGRGKTLSMAVYSFEASSLATIIAGYLVFPIGIPMSATLGWPMPFNATVCDLVAWKGASVGDLTLEMRASGSAIASITIGSGAQHGTASVNADVSAGALLTAYATSAISVGCGITAFYRRRI